MTAKGTLYKLLWILITGFGIYLLLPCRPLEIVSPNLDGSWRIALQVAFDRGLVFGRDFIFTYGPLGFLSARVYANSTRWLILSYDIFIALQLVLICVTIYLRTSALTSLGNLFGVLFVLSGAIYFMDPPIILFIFSTFWLYEGREKQSFAKFILSLLNALLSFYIKVNLGVAAIGQLALSGLLDLFNPATRRAASLRLISTALAIGGSMLIIHVDVLKYLVASLHIANGFNDAMYLDLDKTDYLIWALVTIAALTLALLLTLIKGRNPILVVSCAGFTFLLFKQGFVRSDDHIYVFFDYIVCCFALLAHFTSGRLRVFNSTLLSAVIGLSIYLNHMPWDQLPLKRSIEKYGELARYSASLAQSPSSTIPEAALNPAMSSAVGTSSVDLMPDNTSRLYYSGLNYVPRPVIQSYTSYDHYLDQINGSYFLERGPEFLFFSHGCVDGRFCLHDDTEAKLALLRQYEVVTTDSEMVLLKRRQTALPETRTLIKSGRIRLGDRLPIEQDGTLKVAVFTIQYSLRGKVRRFFYKPQPLKITIGSGKDKYTFRAASPILNGGVIASHFINDQSTLPDFFKHNFSELPQIKFIRLHSDYSNNFSRYIDYQVYRVTFQ